MAPEARFRGVGIYVDFRNPPRWPRDDGILYGENIELIRAAERLGFASVWLSEHHFSHDGYAPAPLMIAAAVAQATTTIRIGTAVAVLPLYHWLRFVEDVTVLDILSRGRVELGVGVGWRPQEFAAFGVSLAERGRRTDETLAAMQSLWRGEPLTVRIDGGEEHLQLMPRPVQRPGPPIWVGGSGQAMLRRAARFGDGIVVSGFTEAMDRGYRDALVAAGRDPDARRVASNLRWFMVATDPERAFAHASPHVIEWYNHYASWMAGGGGPFTFVADDADLRGRGLLTVVTPDEAVRVLLDHLQVGPLTYINVKARPPGMAFEDALEHLELLATVLPPLQQASAAATL